MSIADVRVLPLRASRHLAFWIVWHAVRVSLIEDDSSTPPPKQRKRRAAA
jgi:hypothetical protein